MLTLSLLNEEEIRLLYEQKMKRDFPPSELKSLNAILNMVKAGVYDVFCASQAGNHMAYALLYRPEDGHIVLLDYLAVEPQHREKGIGTRFLRLLQQHYSSAADALLIECERPVSAPDEQEARKRIRFYERAGAKMTSVRVWLFNVEYSILVFPCRESIPQRDWAWQILKLYRMMLPQEMYEQNVRLIRG